ncbi:hypothetical protein Pryu01_00532 [Paraliobacillus ryukyuensis]|uniref:Uncharacterized protein n=1 Tax=Paraliobacillus ryukyuensis TaxID=200904 RepID=A0A366EHB8_9BACI|nr:hypothetical protein [Paraliobacillus ryukyuensis]RBP01396.1 hypothetical protein DES48_101132 [Paraliobacillus ryukyuensis]
MRNVWWMMAVAIGGMFILKKRYKIINMLLAITMIRKLIVTIGMRIPLVRNEIMSNLLQPTK